MRPALVNTLITAVVTSALPFTAMADTPAQTGLAALPPGELRVEIHSPSTATELSSSTGEAVRVEVEGAASTIGGVRHIDMMLVMDTSMSLRKSDPDDYRVAAAVGLVESLSARSDTRIGVIGFSNKSELMQPLTSDRQEAIAALHGLKRTGGTNIADGIRTALAELRRDSRPDSSSLIMLFTDGMSNERNAREATLEAQEQGVAIQTLLLGENLKGGFLLEEIAAATGGSFAWVRDPSELPEAFRNLRTTGVDNVTLSVNGSEPIPATLSGASFSGELPLSVGENHIVARARSLHDQIEEISITVNVTDASCAAVEVAALNDGQPALSLNDRSVEIVVDASRSMWGRIDDTPKMQVAKDTLHDATSWLPGDISLALRAYGNTSPSEEGNCQDSSLLVGFEDDNRTVIRDAIGELRPVGQTPIAFALREAAADFQGLSAERTVVLVTDGIESCGGDPVATARELKAQGITIHLIGFGMSSAADEDTASLQAIADAGGGQYLTANSAEELKQALETSVGTRYRVLQKNAVVASGVLGNRQPFYLPLGDYRLELDSVPAHTVDFSLAARDQLTLMLEKRGDAIAHSEYRDLLEPTSCSEAVAGRARSTPRRDPELTSTDRAAESTSRFIGW